VLDQFPGRRLIKDLDETLLHQPLEQVMRAALDSTLETTLVMTSTAGGILQNSEHAKEARRAVMEKRRGQLKGI
jgi:hypothetical protein